ncbi:hypothetical protein Baya_6230 [Bagarius yarrelli]|uniref:Transmembrane protein 154 n=1 Tax=Bagarius yarrelli TaxID=175774 RepID=A0A556TZZ6_BAGYA|nr:hypothetical protein Baya_6230 [Bagarius yarrelli]
MALCQSLALSKGYYCHRGLWEMTLRVLLLILALAACLTEPGCCAKKDGSGFPRTKAPKIRIFLLQEEEVSGGAETFAQVTLEQNWHSNNTQDDTTETVDTWNVFIIGAVCVSLAFILAAVITGIHVACRRRQKSTTEPEKDDPYLDDEFEEKVPMPMFEDDMPSVMELEMEDLEKWVIKKGQILDVSVVLQPADVAKH